MVLEAKSHVYYCKNHFEAQRLRRPNFDCITRMRGSAIRCVRSQWERPIFAPHPSETPQPILMSCQIYYYVPPGS